MQDLGVGDLVLIRQSLDERSGRVTVAPAVNTTSITQLGEPNLFFGDIVYSGIENVDVSPKNPLNGATGTAPGGQIVVFDSDPFEYNDDILNPTDIGDFEKVTRNPTIDPGNSALRNVLPTQNGDEDWYAFTPKQDGTFQINTLFTALPVANPAIPGVRPGLPGNGVLATGLYNAIGAATAPLVVGSPLNSATGATIGNQLQFAGLEGVTYYLRVTGGGVIAAATPGGLPAVGTVSASAAINTYDISLAQIDELGPQVTAVAITSAPTFNLFANKPLNAAAGPTPAVRGLTISFRDLVSAAQRGSSVAATLGALDPATALAPGNYSLVGDHSGPIQITNVSFAIPPTPVTITSAVAAGPPIAANTFVGGAGLSPIPNFYVGQAVQFTSGPQTGQARTITAIPGGGSRIFTFDAPFTSGTRGRRRLQHLAGDGSRDWSQCRRGNSGSHTDHVRGPGTLSAINGFFVGQVLQFTGGALTGQEQVITAYNATGNVFTFENPFTGAPAAGDAFSILPIPVAAVNLDVCGWGSASG